MEKYLYCILDNGRDVEFENHYSEFEELLEKLKGKRELGVKALLK